MTDQNPIEEEGPKSLSQWAQEINEIGNTKWVEFYAEMLGTRPTNMGRFIRAIKLYGFFPVFEAIVDMSSRDLTGDPLNYFNKVAASKWREAQEVVNEEILYQSALDESKKASLKANQALAKRLSKRNKIRK